jgi:hypothetical protein
MPRVLNKRRDKIPPEAVLVDRTTKWGNPYKIGKPRADGSGPMCRTEVIDRFKQWLEKQPVLLAAMKEELRGKDLVCWCVPERCHAEILLELANGE